MNMLGISNYGISDSGGVVKNPSSSAADSSGSSLGLDDFLGLLAAQFQNQDVMNPTDNTEFIAELAQFSSLQAMNQLNQYADRQYAASLIGRTVVVGQYDATGQYSEKQGIVSSAYFSSDGSIVVVGNTAYNVGDVIQVLQDGSAADPSPDPDPDPDPDPTPDPDPGTGDPEG